MKSFVTLFSLSRPVRLQGLIYVGTSEGVVRVPTANCSFYWTCPQCVLARDPFCGWDPASRACVEVSNSQTSLWVSREDCCYYHVGPVSSCYSLAAIKSSGSNESFHQRLISLHFMLIAYNVINVCLGISPRKSDYHTERWDQTNLLTEPLLHH